MYLPNNVHYAKRKKPIFGSSTNADSVGEKEFWGGDDGRVILDAMVYIFSFFFFFPNTHGRTVATCRTRIPGVPGFKMKKKKI